MKSKQTFLIASFSAALLVSATAGAQQAQPKPERAQQHDMSKMQGHDMSNVQGHDMSKMKGQEMKGHSPGSMELHQIMMSGAKMPMPMSGKVDRDFASMMTIHHQQAIKMSDVLLKHGSDEELKAMARKMKSDQKDEIEKLARFKK